MPIKIKNTEWVQFKAIVLKMLGELGGEQDKIDIPDSPENFELYVNNCEVHPVFIKRAEYMKLEYDFSLCDTKLRLLSVYMYANVIRIDFSLKDGFELEKKKEWEENQS